MRTGTPGTTYDAHELARIAALQHGVVTSRQLNECGLSRGQISYMVRAGRLHRVHRRTYAVGHPGLSTKGQWMAAVLAAGPGAVLGGLAAARLHRIGRRRRVKTVVVVPKRRRPIPGVELIVVSDLQECEIDHVDGIPTLSVSRTIVHAASLVPIGELTKLISEAAHFRLLDLDRICALVGDGSRREGCGAVRTAVGLYVAGEHGTDSALEDRVHVWLQDMASQPFRSNVHLQTDEERLRVDVYWEHIALVPEIDGSGHRRPDARRRDAKRTRMLAGIGIDVVRIDGELFDRNPIAALSHVRDAVRTRELALGITHRWGD